MCQINTAKAKTKMAYLNVVGESLKRSRSLKAGSAFMHWSMTTSISRIFSPSQRSFFHTFQFLHISTTPWAATTRLGPRAATSSWDVTPPEVHPRPSRGRGRMARPSSLTKPETSHVSHDLQSGSGLHVLPIDMVDGTDMVDMVWPACGRPRFGIKYTVAQSVRHVFLIS